MAEVKRPQEFDEWFDPRADSYQYGAEGPALDAWNEQQQKIAVLERRLRDLCERYRELQAREVTNHDFECCIISAQKELLK